MQDNRNHNGQNRVKSMKVIVFIVLLAGLVALLSNTIECVLLKNDRLVPEPSRYIYRFEREKEDSIDILVLGDSLSMSSISPLSLWKDHGYTCYIIGRPGHNMREVEDMFRFALRKQSPKVVIMETNTLFCERRRGESISDRISALMTFDLPLYRGHDFWKVLLPKEYVEEKYASFKGFALRYKVKPYTKGPYMIETDRKETFPEGNLAHMDSILAMCRECGAELLLVGAPSPENDTYERYNALSEYAESRGIKYLELNLCTEEIGIDWETDSLDRGDHLNLSGAEKVTEYLGHYLADNYAIADHRNDDAFAEWFRESAEYEKIAGEKLKEIRAKKKPR